MTILMPRVLDNYNVDDTNACTHWHPFSHAAEMAELKLTWFTPSASRIGKKQAFRDRRDDAHGHVPATVSELPQELRWRNWVIFGEH